MDARLPRSQALAIPSLRFRRLLGVLPLLLFSSPALAIVIVDPDPLVHHRFVGQSVVHRAEGERYAECRGDHSSREHLAAYKVPRVVQFVSDLPRTSTGKVMRRELRTLDD